MRACELGGVLGGDPSYEVLKRGGLHLVVTEVVPSGGGADKKEKRKKSSCAVQYLSEGHTLFWFPGPTVSPSTQKSMSHPRC